MGDINIYYNLWFHKSLDAVKCKQEQNAVICKSFKAYNWEKYKGNISESKLKIL